MLIVQGFLMVGFGFLILIFRPKIKDFTGDIGFAERYLGVGGTWTFLALLGILFIVGGVLWGAGTIRDILGTSFGGIF